MGFTDWFKFGSKKEGVKVTKIKTESVDMGAMAVNRPSEAVGTLSRMVDQKHAPTKVLMVQDGEYVPQVTEYTLKMAGRLGCDIIALDVSARPLQFTADRRTREKERFIEKAAASWETFSRQAEAQGIQAEHVVKIGNSEEIIAQLSADDVGIRYVLTKPGNEAVRKEEARTHIPVVDLHCSRL